MKLIRRMLAVLAAALWLGGPAPAASPQTMTGSWVRVATAGSGLCVTVSTSDATGQTSITSSAFAPAPTDQGRIVHFFNPVSGYVIADLWAKGPPGSTVAVDTGFCFGGGVGGATTPVLQALSLSNTTGTAGSSFSATIGGLSQGSSLAATASDGTSLAISNGVLSGTFAAAGSKQIALIETLAGATGSPRTTNISVTISSAAPVLQALALASQSATAGTPFSTTVTGQTAGSSIAASSTDGTALAVSGGTLSGTFAAAGSPTVTLVETLAGATGSPKSTQVVVTVSAAPSGGGPITASLADPTFTATVLH